MFGASSSGRWLHLAFGIWRAHLCAVEESVAAGSALPAQAVELPKEPASADSGNVGVQQEANIPAANVSVDVQPAPSATTQAQEQSPPVSGLPC